MSLTSSRDLHEPSPVPKHSGSQSYCVAPWQSWLIHTTVGLQNESRLGKPAPQSSVVLIKFEHIFTEKSYSSIKKNSNHEVILKNGIC